MSLVKCPSCSKDVSPNAVSCPGCGEPLRKQHKASERVEVVTQTELRTEQEAREFPIIITSIIIWCTLLYFTYLFDVAIFENIFGTNAVVPDYIKWINFVIILIPPTVITFFAILIFQKVAPVFFYITVYGTILVVFFVMQGS